MPQYTFTIDIPAWLDSILVALVLAARRLRYGCAFRRIKLTRGKYAIVDAEDYERLLRYKWSAHLLQGTNNYYAMRGVSNKRKQKKIWMHREIMAEPLRQYSGHEKMVVDHINRNSLDNRKANLRLATRQQNIWNSNRGKNTGSSRYKGVCWDKNRKRWRVRIKQNEKQLSFGYHKNETEAAKAYDEAIKQLRGEYAFLNFPDD